MLFKLPGGQDEKVAEGAAGSGWKPAIKETGSQPCMIEEPKRSHPRLIGKAFFLRYHTRKGQQLPSMQHDPGPRLPQETPLLTDKTVLGSLYKGRFFISYCNV